MKKLDKTSEHFRINEVAALIEMSKMYTEKDLCEFAEWCNGNSWLYANYSKLWTNIGGVQKTTSQLREQWEIETGKISSINKKQGCALEAKDICDYDEKCDDCPHFHWYSNRKEERIMDEQLVCVLCGEPWIPEVKNLCECGGMCTWGYEKGGHPLSWHKNDKWIPNSPSEEQEEQK